VGACTDSQLSVVASYVVVEINTQRCCGERQIFTQQYYCRSGFFCAIFSLLYLPYPDDVVP
jgi:hypothetical protein